MHKDDPSVLFTLKTEALDDRDYDLNEVVFERFIARTFCMNVELRGDFKKYAEDGPYLSVPSGAEGGCNNIVRNDLGYRVERIMRKMGRDQKAIFEYKKVTVEEIEDTLIIIAAQNEGSSEAIKSLAKRDKYSLDRLENIYLRLQGSQAKWLTRMIFKDFGFVIPDNVALSAFHTSFPRSLQVTAKFNIKDLVPIRRCGETGIIVAHAPPQTAKKTLPVSKDQTISGLSVAQPAESIQLVSPSSTRSSLPLSESTASSLNATQKATQKPLPPSSSNIKSPQKNPSPQALSPPASSPAAAECAQTPTCHFHNTLFILAPCISSFLWLTSNLLPSHGVTYITSLLPLTRKALPKR
ncbi:hypothetical protein SBOR_6207 [Sclerotinia borealis F-4128]|uniref:DNA ligase ATP-dependent N-terminal domain-containing protein n=1 Tax=Sclerotinia borealis (strain F-4128) TaxID=1432307 RepID=W9CF71_SCLBF|nr:hypothetical protein SBOR_6207 [Sclerotinia borealis F-4128]